MSYPYLVYKTLRSSTEIRFSREGDDLVMLDTVTGEPVVFNDYFASGWLQQEIHLSDATGVILGRPEVDAALANAGIVPGGVNLYGPGALTGTSYMDALFAADGGGVLWGQGGNDSLYGTRDAGQAGVVFEGGAGNDMLHGSIGADTYRFRSGDGFDTIVDRIEGAAAIAAFEANPGAFRDRLELGEGIRPQDVIAYRAGWDLRLSIAGTDDQVAIVDWFADATRNKIEEIAFQDGTVWNASQVEGMLVDAPYGFPYPSGVSLSGGGVLAGTVRGDDLTATAYGTRLEGGAGNDILQGAVDGGVFDLAFVGGEGNDLMLGSYGRDVYHYALGDGHDTIRDDVRQMGPDVAAFFAAHPGTETYQDKLVFGAGIDAEYARAERQGSNLVLHLQGEYGSITVDGWYDGTMFNKIESFVFADGTTWLASDIDAMLGEWSSGMVLSGGGTLAGSQYSDTLTATAYGTVLEGGAGNDRLEAGVNGGIFDLSFHGGRGNDVLVGSYARDVYHYARGDGRDLIQDDVRDMGPDVAAFFAAHPGTESYQDQLVFGAGISASDIAVQRVDNDLLLTVKDDTGGIKVDDWYDGTMFNKIESFAFADGTTWLASDIDAMLGEWSAGMVLSGGGTLAGSQYNDTLTATGYGTRLEGGAGNDRLEATVDGGVFALDFSGGAGNDILVGSYGGDTYHWSAGDGNDLIIDDVRSMGPGVADYFLARPNTETYQDKFVFGAGIGRWDVRPDRIGDDLVLWTNQDQNRITIQDWFDGTFFNKIESFHFEDGSSWLASDLDQMLDAWANGIVAGGTGTIEGSQYSDTLTATGFQGRLEGGAGNDMLYSTSDAEFTTFVGGRGNDVLNGNDGWDLYGYYLGDGNDLIRDLAGNDELHFCDGITPGSITRSRSGDDLVLGVNQSGQVTIEDWFDGSYQHQIERISFDDGTYWYASTVEYGLL